MCIRVTKHGRLRFGHVNKQENSAFTGKQHEYTRAVGRGTWRSRHVEDVYGRRSMRVMEGCVGGGGKWSVCMWMRVLDAEMGWCGRMDDDWIFRYGWDILDELLLVYRLHNPRRYIYHYVIPQGSLVHSLHNPSTHTCACSIIYGDGVKHFFCCLCIS